jgi:hypothetical protein
METSLVLMTLALLVFAAVIVYLLVLSRRGAPKGSAEAAGGSVESIRRVGELVVLRAVYSVPAVGRESIWGEKGKAFLSWLWSESRSIMIFRFEINFKYDLRNESSVSLRSGPAGGLEVELGTPRFDIGIQDVRFYHTEQGRLLDWLLPRALGLFQSNMDDETRQRMLEAARTEAIAQAEEMIANLSDEARRSAEATLKGLARGLGFQQVIVTHREQEAA